MYFSVEFTTFMSVIAGFVTFHTIPKLRSMFIKANLFGVDLNKSSGDKVPEATGVITGNELTYIYTVWVEILVDSIFWL